MLLDNENKNLKVHEWITKYTENGTLNIVTGYFTVGALAYLSQKTKHNIDGVSKLKKGDKTAIVRILE